MFDDLVRQYKQEKGIDDIEQARNAVRNRDASMQITPGPAMGWADSDEDRSEEIWMPDEKYANAIDPEQRENHSRKSQRKLLTDAKT